MKEVVMSIIDMASGTRGRILIIDDEVDVREVLKLHLSEWVLVIVRNAYRYNYCGSISLIVWDVFNFGTLRLFCQRTVLC